MGWGEGTSDAASPEGSGAGATAGDATWIHSYFNASTWQIPGGDYSPTVSASAEVGQPFDDVGQGPGKVTWTSAQMVADAQAWLDTPATNFGWILIGNEAQLKTAKRFNSRENPNSSNRPVLTLDYFPPEPTPTPTPTYSPTPTPIGTPTPTPSPVPTATPTPTPEPTATPLPPLTVVPPAEIKAPDVEHGTVVVVQPTSGASVAFPEQGLELQIPAFAQQATLQVLVRSPDVAELPVTADTEVLRAVGIEFFDASGTPKQNVRLWLSARLDFALTDAQIDRIGGLSAVLSEFAAGRIRIRRFSAANAGQLTNLNATFDLITRTFSASTAQFSVFVLTWDREARLQATPTVTPTAPPSPTATMTPAPTLTPTVTFTGLVPETGGFSVSRAALSKMLLLVFLLLVAGIFLWARARNSDALC